MAIARGKGKILRLNVLVLAMSGNRPQAKEYLPLKFASKLVANPTKIIPSDARSGNIFLRGVAFSPPKVTFGVMIRFKVPMMEEESAFPVIVMAMKIKYYQKVEP